MATPENSIKTNIQLFRKNNDFSERFFRCIAPPNDLQQRFLWLFNDTFATSKYFGYFIWDNNLSDLVPFFSRDYFAENWTAIIDAFKVAGTFEAYLLIIQSALGADTEITFSSPSPSHLIINITEPTGNLAWNAYKNNEFAQVIPFKGINASTTIGAQQSAILNILGATSGGTVYDLTPSANLLADEYFIFRRSLSDLTVNETLKLIELLNVNGVFVEVNF